MTKIFKFLLCVAFLIAFACTTPLLAQSNNHPVAPLSATEIQKWRQDLRYLAEEMPKRHQNLFHAMTREQFESAVKRLDERIPTLARHQVIVELGRIVAMVKDGHTAIQSFPFDPKINFRSYPLTLYLFKDGLFVMAADPKYANAVGGRVVKIGNATTEQALSAVRDLIFHDNEMGIRGGAPFALVTPETLHAVGLIKDMENAPFVIERGGQQFTINLQPFVRPAPTGHGTNFFKPAGWVDANGDAQAPLPLYLKDPENLYWFEYLPETKTVYVQYNGVQNKPDKNIEAFAKRLFAFVEKNPVDRFILDMRRNGGGNNYLNRPLLVGLIKSKVDERGKLFTIIGRRTFSAAQNLINELEKYTNTIFVGEPTGENVNFYGDSAGIELPNSGIVVRASTLWWQNMDPRDRRQWTGPHVAAELTSEDYRNNIDPAMKAIMSYVPKKELTESLMEALSKDDVELAKKLFREYKNDPVNAYLDIEAPVNTFGYRLMEMKRLEQAIEIFKLNVEAFPKSANAYDSLGEAYLNAGNKELALRNYEKAVELNPNNNPTAISIIRKLREK
jgi:tetratricopeptide (TPR) repeat protein